jgi:hypothetical protein
MNCLPLKKRFALPSACDLEVLSERRISGFSPIYSLLRLSQAEKGQVLRYDRGITDQYNSTVTYASMAFF